MLNMLESGHATSDETRRKISISLIGNQRAKGNRFSLTDAQRAHLSSIRTGPANPAWRGGVSPTQQRIRRSRAYREWRTAVFVRDDYRCTNCGARNGTGSGVSLQADHIKPFADYPALRFDLDNGRTLCVPCHRKTETYGYRKARAA